jgi:hypothetical protein
MKRLSLLLGFTLAFAVCGMTSAQDTPTPEKAPAPEKAPTEGPEEERNALSGVNYFPLDAGRRWHYKVKFVIQPADGGARDEATKDDQGDHYLDVYVADPVKIDNVRVAALEWKLDQALAQRSYFRVKGDSLVCFRRLQGANEHVKDFTLDPPQPVVPKVLKVGQEWTWKGRSGPSAGQQTFKVLRAETLELPSGTFKTLVLETEFTGEDDSRGKTTRWLAPGVGLVKEISEVRTPKQVFRSEGVLVRYEK